MGIFSRIKKGVKAKANAAVDKAMDPEKELDLAIAGMEEQLKSSVKELVSFKASEKLMKAEMARQQERAEVAEKRAMVAVKAGDDELARKCLAAKREAMAEHAKVKRDWQEAAGLAIELNRNRKTLEQRLKLIKLKRGTMASQIAAARSGQGVLGDQSSLFERFAQAEGLIDDEAVMAEVEAAADGAFDDSVISRTPEITAAVDTGDADGALAALKAKMERQGRDKALPPDRSGDE